MHPPFCLFGAASAAPAYGVIASRRLTFSQILTRNASWILNHASGDGKRIARLTQTCSHSRHPTTQLNGSATTVWPASTFHRKTS
ncbi:MAG: hypothetical protein MZV70_30210 [Desulfobacterales bacterium]|nr:hypothetical protein [Desulfobacterales bacterium]